MAADLGKSRIRNLNTYRKLVRKFVETAMARFPTDKTAMVNRFHSRFEALGTIRKVADEIVNLTLKAGVGESKVFRLNDSDLVLHMTVGYHGEVDAYLTMEWDSSAYAHAYLNLLLYGLGILNTAANPFALSQVK